MLWVCGLSMLLAKTGAIQSVDPAIGNEDGVPFAKQPSSATWTFVS